MATPSKSTRSASKSPASEAPTDASVASPGAPAPGPNVTVDHNAPVDPLIERETEALRADAAKSTADAAVPPAGTERPLSGADAPEPARSGVVEGLGAAAGSSQLDPTLDSLGRNAGAEAPRPSPIYRGAYIPAVDPIRPFTLAGAPRTIPVQLEGVAGDLVELREFVALPAGTHYLWFYSRREVDREAVELGARVTSVVPSGLPTRLLRLVDSMDRPIAGSDALIELAEPLEGLAATASVTAAAERAQPDEIPLATPAVQPVAVVDPAFLRVHLSAKITKAAGAVVTFNSEARSEPGHAYALRYVDVNGAAHIRLVEPFVGPTDTLTLRGDALPPLVGSDVQLGSLSISDVVQGGEEIDLASLMDLKPMPDGSAIAVTRDGRKIRVVAS